MTLEAVRFVLAPLANDGLASAAMLKLGIGLVFGVGLVAFACQHAPADGGKAPSAGSAAPSAESAEPEKEPEPAASAAPAAPKGPIEVTDCNSAMDEYDRLLGTATYECAKDKDCKCYEGRYSRDHGHECGGVADAKTVKELEVVAKKGKKMSCANNAQCEAWTCDPICEEGRCQKGPRKK